MNIIVIVSVVQTVATVVGWGTKHRILYAIVAAMRSKDFTSLMATESCVRIVCWSSLKVIRMMTSKIKIIV